MKEVTKNKRAKRHNSVEGLGTLYKYIKVPNPETKRINQLVKCL